MRTRVQAFHRRYRHLIMPIALIGGFIADIFTLNRIDQVFDNAILILHLLIVATAVALLFSRGTPFADRHLSERRRTWLQAAVVFSLGALFSGFVIFYTRSGSLITSWPFVAAALALMLGTEFKKQYFYRLQLQLVVFAVAVVSWAIFFVPVVIKRMGPVVFLASTVVALVLIGWYLRLLARINRHKFRIHQKKVVTWILGVVLAFNALYFTNILPPIPLSLKYQAVYYEVERLYPGYRALYEPSPWYVLWNRRDRTMRWSPGEDLFVFTQVFAPTKLEANIHHVWQFYDQANRRWETRSSIPIHISGGRDDGYRGFSTKSSLEYGTWRVKTETPNGQTLEIINFKVVPYDGSQLHLVWEEL